MMPRIARKARIVAILDIPAIGVDFTRKPVRKDYQNHVSLRFFPDEQARLDTMAAQAGTSPTEFCLNIILKHIEKT